MKKTTKIVSLMAIIGVACFVAPVYPGGQLNDENGSGILIGEHWDLNASLSNRTPGDGRTIEVYFAQGTSAARIAAIQASHGSWEALLAMDFDDVSNTLPHAPSNGAGGGTPDGYNTHSFEFTLGCGGGLGVTPTVINATTGQIVEADVFYEGNNCVRWSTDGSPTGRQFELEAVAVHEMGHFIGLSHSGDFDATMFPSISNGSAGLPVVTLEPDDNSSAVNVYNQDGGDVNVPTGGISGRIIDGTNSSDGKVCALVYAFDTDEAPITLFTQAHVQVYSGSVIGASASSNTSGPTSGSYTINGLPDGDWFVLLDPIGNVVNANQISNWCANNSEAGFAQEWWNGIAESGAEGCTTCALAVTVSGGQITTGIDIFTETGTCNTTEDPEVSCADGIDNDCDGFADSEDDDCQGGCTTNGDCDDANECTTDTCNAGTCSNTAVADDTSCNAGSGICCSGTCTTAACDNNGDCDDGDSCTTDTCNNGGTCAASCDNSEPPCQNGDGCCPSGCNSGNDDDCPSCGGHNAPCTSNDDCCSNNCKPNGKCSKP